jgi:hypothetical protein
MEKTEDIKLSEKHGLNPSIAVCPICGKDVGVALFGELKDDEQAPKKVLANEICDECKEKNPDKVYIVEIDDNQLTGKYALIDKTLLIEEYKDKDLFYISKEEFEKLTSNESEN